MGKKHIMPEITMASLGPQVSKPIVGGAVVRERVHRNCYGHTGAKSDKIRVMIAYWRDLIKHNNKNNQTARVQSRDALICLMRSILIACSCSISRFLSAMGWKKSDMALMSFSSRCSALVSLVNVRHRTHQSCGDIYRQQ